MLWLIWRPIQISLIGDISDWVLSDQHTKLKYTGSKALWSLIKWCLWATSLKPFCLSITSQVSVPSAAWNRMPPLTWPMMFIGHRGAWGNRICVGVLHDRHFVQPAIYTLFPSSCFFSTSGISLCLFGVSGCICTHTSIKITTSSLCVQSELIKTLCLHSWVPEQLLNSCIFRISFYFWALLLLHSSLTPSAMYCEGKATVKLAIFNKSPF